MDLEFKSFQKLPRLNEEHMYISEKIDGTNAQIMIYEDFEEDNTKHKIFIEAEDKYGWEKSNETLKGAKSVRKMKIGSRNRWITLEDDNFGFARWCKTHEAELIKLPVGRHYGEWWGNGIQRTYGMKEKKLSLFNQSLYAVKEIIPCIDFVPVLYDGPFDLDVINTYKQYLKQNGSAAAPGFNNPEGVVVYLKRASIMFKLPFDNEHKGVKLVR